MAIQIDRHDIPNTVLGLSIRGILMLLEDTPHTPVGAAAFFEQQVAALPRPNMIVPSDWYKAELNEDFTECRIIRKGTTGPDKLLATITTK